jgi:hypothetical protein
MSHIDFNVYVYLNFFLIKSFQDLAFEKLNEKIYFLKIKPTPKLSILNNIQLTEN